MKTPVILKKYGNRRLYDARRSGYVTLAEVEELLQSGEDVQVIDAKTGEDLTRAVLVQIILEREESREALPVAFLKQVIRVGRSPLRETFSRTLTMFLDGFLDMQREAQRGLVEAQRGFSAMSPLAFMANPFAAFAPPPPRVGEPAPARAEAHQNGEELERLREELKETQSLVRELLEEMRASTEKNGAQSPARSGRSRAKKAAARSRRRGARS